MIRKLLRLLGFRSRSEVWRDCVYAEARSRGLKIEEIHEGGVLLGWRLTGGGMRPLYVVAKQ